MNLDVQRCTDIIIRAVETYLKEKPPYPEDALVEALLDTWPSGVFPISDEEYGGMLQTMVFVLCQNE